jgi:hypothetical protein
MARLHTRRKADGAPRIIAMPTMTDPDTLNGLTVPFDPKRIRDLPRVATPQDMALSVALVGLALLDRTTIPTADLARMCGLTEADLAVALARACGRKGDGTPKFFHATVSRGIVTLAVVMQRLLRPERYVRLSVEALATAPTADHARLYVLAAEAAIGDDRRGTHIVSAPTNYLSLNRAAEPDADLAAMVAWAQAWFGDATAGRILSGGIDDDTIYVAAANTCNWAYDHRAAPRPWTDDDYWKRSRLRERDGQWDGHDLSVDAIRAAKVCEWIKRDRCRVGARSIRTHWLTALNMALAGKSGADGERLLASIREHGATAAFERWTLAKASRLDTPLPWVERVADEGAALRRVAAANPDAPGLRPYATDPVRGEQLCHLQYRWRVSDPILNAYRAGQITRADCISSLASAKVSYRVGGREPPPLREHRVKPNAVSRERLEAMGLWLMMQSDMADSLIPVIWEIVVCATHYGAQYDGIAALADAMAERVAGSPHWAGWQRAWRQAGHGGEALEQAARRAFVEAFEATADGGGGAG